MVFYIYNELCVKIVLSEKVLLSFKSLKLAQNLHGNKTGFVRPGHNLLLYINFNLLFHNKGHVIL